MKSTYTAIPPTSDADYWELKFEENKTRVFVPRDRDLHRQLLIKQRKGKSSDEILIHTHWRLRLDRQG